VAFGFICFCYSSSLYSEKETTKAEEKMQLYDECMKKISSLIKNIAREENVNQVYKRIAESIYDLCLTLLGGDENVEILYCVAIKKSNDYDIVVNHKMPEAVDFKIIESRYYETAQSCVLSQTYFYLIFENRGKIESIVYFEGANEVLSPFFIKAIETIYTILDIVLSNKNNSGITKDEQKLLVNLAKDVESATGGNETHVDRVARYTHLILKEMGYSDSTCDLVSNAAALHDIGKIAIPGEIVSKYGSLSNKERSIMNKHTEYGREILGSIDTEFMKIAAEIASEHHERYDGSGYNKKSGEEISMYARIVAVADVFDALTTRRSYKEAWSVDDAVNAINQASGKNFDPTVVAAFNNIVGSLKENISE
jgi:HD-GYP domain-containing protein (c-di-GMP phosphodiesterase class II)